MLESLYRLLGSVIAFFYDLVPNYGVAIILLTIFVRLILLPLTIKQTKSMQAMQKIQPQMKELQAKHKGDKQKLQEEMMKLYKTHQVNPLGGCLPLVLQFPVFIALFRVLNACGVKVAKGQHCPATQIGTKYLPASSGIIGAIHAGNTGFLGMSMAATPREVLATSGMLAAFPYLVLLAAMGLTTWYQTKQAQGAQPPGANAQMAIVGKIMPVMLMFFSFQFPAGVSIYWVVSNMWTIGQQRILLGKVRTEARPAASPAGRPKAAGIVSPKGGEAKSDGIKGATASNAPAAKQGRPKGAASKAAGSPNGGSAKAAKPKPQGGPKAAGGGNGKAAGDGAPRAGGAQRPPGSGARKKRRR